MGIMDRHTSPVHSLLIFEIEQNIDKLSSQVTIVWHVLSVPAGCRVLEIMSQLKISDGVVGVIRGSFLKISKKSTYITYVMLKMYKNNTCIYLHISPLKWFESRL